MKPHATILGLAMVLLFSAASPAAQHDSFDFDGTAISGARYVLPFLPTLEDIQANVFSPICASMGCHDAMQNAGLDLRAGASFGNLVGVTAFEDSSMSRVEPFDPDSSFLICKIEASACLAWMPMPPPAWGPLLDPAVIEAIRVWIYGGAIESGLATSAGSSLKTSTWGRVKALYSR